MDQNNENDTINIDETKRMIKLGQNNLRKLKENIIEKNIYFFFKNINDKLFDIYNDNDDKYKESVKNINSYNLGKIVNVLYI